MKKIESYGISIADIVSGKVSSDDLAKYGISANVLDGLKIVGMNRWKMQLRTQIYRRVCRRH